MPYSREILDKVQRYFDSLTVRRSAERQRRRDEVYAAIPRVAEIDGEIDSLGLRLSRLALSSGDIDGEINRTRERITLLKREKAALMTAAGYAPDFCEKVYSCNRCKDTGFVNGEACNCFKAMAQTEAYRLSGLGELLDKQNFETFNINQYPDESVNGVNAREHMKSVFEECVAFAAQFPSVAVNGLLLYGGPGLGKTFLSSCIAKVVLDKGFTVVYQTAPRIFSILEESKFGQSWGENRECSDSLYNCDLLIIDDLGAEFTTRYTVSALFDIINTRMVQGKKTIISSNLSLKDINEKYSTRIFSRLAEFKYLCFIGEDIRLMRKYGV